MGKYLSLPEHFSRKKRDLFVSIVDRMHQCAVSWSSRCLSTAGKLTLLKAVLAAIPTFPMSCFQLPVSLCKKIQSVMTRFWWDSNDGKRKMSWVAWDKMTLPKGGEVLASKIYNASTSLSLQSSPGESSLIQTAFCHEFCWVSTVTMTVYSELSQQRRSPWMARNPCRKRPPTKSPWQGDW